MLTTLLLCAWWISQDTQLPAAVILNKGFYSGTMLIMWVLCAFWDTAGHTAASGGGAG